MGLKDIFDLVKTTFKEWSEDKAPRLAAALAYYTAFSIAPMLVIAIGIAGLVWGRQAAEGAIVQQIGGLVGSSAAQTIQGMIQNVSQQGTGVIATVIGVVTLLLGASGVFGQLQDSLNTMWEVRPKPDQGITAIIKKRVFSFGVVIVIGFLLLVSLVVSAALAVFAGLLRGWLPGGDVIFTVVNFLVSFAVTTFLFALVFKYLPDAEIAWKDVWLGSAITALLFAIGRFAIGLYLGNSNIGSTFGAAGSFIIILVWVYYSAQILFFGGEFTQVYANQYGSGIVPEPNAERVTENERAEQGIPHRERTQQPGMLSPSAIPVTGQGEQRVQPALTVPLRAAPERGRIWEAALPSLLALAVGVVGSLFIIREQRNLPAARETRKPVKAEVELKVRTRQNKPVHRENHKR